MFYSVLGIDLLLVPELARTGVTRAVYLSTCTRTGVTRTVYLSTDIFLFQPHRSRKQSGTPKHYLLKDAR